MRLISNKGNISGVSENENNPEQIQNAIDNGYEVKVNLWLKDNKLYTGNNEAEHLFSLEFLETNHSKLWLQCHDIELIKRFSEIDPLGLKINYFWIDNGNVVRTSKGVWIVRENEPFDGCVYLNPEINELDYSKCLGLISDRILNYKEKYSN